MMELIVSRSLSFCPKLFQFHLPCLKNKINVPCKAKTFYPHGVWLTGHYYGNASQIDKTLIPTMRRDGVYTVQSSILEKRIDHIEDIVLPASSCSAQSCAKHGRLVILSTGTTLYSTYYQCRQTLVCSEVKPNQHCEMYVCLPGLLPQLFSQIPGCLCGKQRACLRLDRRLRKAGQGGGHMLPWEQANGRRSKSKEGQQVTWCQGVSGGPELIYNIRGGPFSRVTIISDTTRRYNTDFSIHISNITSADAGVYYCVKFQRGSPDVEIKSGPGTWLFVRGKFRPLKIQPSVLRQSQLPVFILRFVGC
ncbi:hypothetical protein J1605_003285 [Eschrichtius robustus]|uniref:Immunoglobulin V-set domain-containing protein n=1 Tax=Eschrichtius robustus TaxID=9764 RepID=A0AB34HQ26_ESCRO|nr:hypothetical protein J1605_003285 [Eschrichtius robustus]